MARLLATVALAAFWWPGRISGLLDGAPLNGLAETVALGLIAPALWWLHPQFFKTAIARAGLAAVIILKLAGLPFTQEGLCVRFDPPAPIVRDSTGRPHSWDVRADWRAPNPNCSAVMTTAYTEFKRFPVWFFNLPPIDNNLPTAMDRPPNATIGMTIVGFVTATGPGALDIDTAPYMDLTVQVDDRNAEQTSPTHYRIDAGAGTHFIQAGGNISGNLWRFIPAWNEARLGSASFPLATLSRPGAVDTSILRSALRWLWAIAAIALIGGWLLSWLSTIASPAVIAWIVVASTWLAYLAPRAGNQFVTSNVARWSVTALALAALVPLGSRQPSRRLAFALVGIPWLVFVGVASIDHVGKFSLYAAGDDMWTYQRFAYRVYLQGYWLEGGQPTFWFQPLYRWIAGALHMVFGDSSIGEFFWDGASLLAIALFAHEAVSRARGFAWGLVAAALSLTLFMQGAAWEHFGIGLSENAASGLIYMSALTAISTNDVRGGIAAGLLATLAFYTRLNNLPMAIAIVALLPVRRLAPAFLGTLALGAVLFAIRTWYYTGVFSLFHGTQFGNLAVWQPGLPFTESLWRTFSSVLMVLTMRDPPAFVWYSLPLLVAALLSIGAVMRIKALRDLPIPLVIFFLAGCSGSIVTRGTAYSGRFSTVLIGAACALSTFCLATVAVRFTAQSALQKPSESA